jgi:Pectate lyase superfamily protein
MKFLITALLLGLFAQSHPDRYVDVTIYGADPTGVKDSLPAVESAMTAACATKPGGAIVWFPAGKYTLSAPIPETSAYWCSGLTLLGSGIRATQLHFSGGNGYAINYPEKLRNVTTKGFLIQITNNDFLGGIFLGGGNFSDTFQDIYIVAPETSRAKGFSTYDTADGTAALLTLDNFRIDGFGGSEGAGFWFELLTAGNQLRCNLCYANGSYIGFYVNGWFLASLNNAAADNNSHVGYLIDNNGTTTLSAASSENDTGVAAFFVEGGAGSTFECDDCKTQSFAGTSSSHPFEFYSHFTGTAIMKSPASVSTGGSVLSSLDVAGTPKGITILGGTSNLDKGLSKRAAAVGKIL